MNVNNHYYFFSRDNLDAGTDKTNKCTHEPNLNLTIRVNQLDFSNFTPEFQQRASFNVVLHFDTCATTERKKFSFNLLYQSNQFAVQERKGSRTIVIMVEIVHFSCKEVPSLLGDQHLRRFHIVPTFFHTHSPNPECMSVC